MKKLINDVKDVVWEQVEGIATLYPTLNKNKSPCYVWHNNSPNQVALVSGGASGHEPMHIGYVGIGMLTGACPGEIFVRATPDQLYECARKVSTKHGILFLVKNYVGDIKNFSLAVELLHADGIKVGSVLIDDDVAVKTSLYSEGRRGIVGTVLVEKIVGAAAVRGYTLEQCEELGRRINDNCRSICVALHPCTVPAAGQPSFELAAHEVEFGVGIHGEPGLSRIAYHNADQLVDKMFNQLTDNVSYSRTLFHWNRADAQWDSVESAIEKFEKDNDYIVIVNGLGGTPISELYIVYRRLAQLCQENDLRIVRRLVGNYCTGLNMQGVSITLLQSDLEMIELFDDPVDTATLRW